MFNEIVERYRQDHPGAIRIVFRNLPLPMHGWAAAAARAGICVFQQNPGAFWEFHDMLFAQQKTLSSENLESFIEQFVAGRSGLDLGLYASCAASGASGDRVEQDLSRARGYDIQSTPTVVVNGRRYTGFRDGAAFAAAIDAATRLMLSGNSNTQKERQFNENSP